MSVGVKVKSRQNIEWLVEELVTQLKRSHCCTNVHTCPDAPSEVLSLTEMGKIAVKPLVEVLKKEEDARVLGGVAQILGRIGDGRAAGSLVHILGHEKLHARLCARNALLNIGKPVEDSLEHSFKNESATLEVQKTIAYILMAIRCEQ